MRILVIGGGGREHALVKKIAESKEVTKIYCAPGNGGIAALAECVPIGAKDIDGVVQFSQENQIDMVVVAPDDPLVLGMVDALWENGIRAFGPNKAAAIIEGSKAFSKELMKNYNIPTAAYHVFENPDEAIAYLDKCDYPTVIKADGLALGKGVIIAQDKAQAIKAVKDIMEDQIFGASGSKIVIEQFLRGREVSVLAFTDGKTLVPMPSAQDHKKVFDDDLGPNTGGMGAYSPSPAYTPEIADYCMEHIFLPTMKAMNQEGRTFKGVLYFGLILTDDGVYVIEYNARFGDPETQAVLPRLKTDLIQIFNAIIDDRLDEMQIEWEENAAVCVVMASGGYPGSYSTGFEIKGIEEAQADESIFVYHAGTKMEGEKILTSGGRVLGVTALGNDLQSARDKAYEGVSKISFENAHYRRDIFKR